MAPGEGGPIEGHPLLLTTHYLLLATYSLPIEGHPAAAYAGRPVGATYYALLTTCDLQFTY